MCAGEACLDRARVKMCKPILLHVVWLRRVAETWSHTKLCKQGAFTSVTEQKSVPEA